MVQKFKEGYKEGYNPYRNYYPYEGKILSGDLYKKNLNIFNLIFYSIGYYIGNITYIYHNSQNINININ